MGRSKWKSPCNDKGAIAMNHVQIVGGLLILLVVVVWWRKGKLKAFWKAAIG